MICNTTIQTIDKALIAERFAKARNTYGSKARVQQLVAEKMLHLLMEHTCTPAAVRNISCNASPFQHIVEFGCGTGYYSRLLLHSLQPDTLLLNDLCSEMEECVKELCTSPAVHFCAGDAELMSFPQETDLITSCSTLQWFSNPEDFFVRCHHFLTDSGILAFSTFGVGAMLVGKISNHHHKHKFIRGEEKGMFEYGGSTVVLIIPPDTVIPDNDILNNTKDGFETVVKMGERIGIKKG